MKNILLIITAIVVLAHASYSQWLIQSYNPSMRGAYFINGTSTGWAVTDNGIIRKTTDGGITWTGQQTGNTNPLNEIFFTNNNIGWAVGENGTILFTANGGSTWGMQNSGTVSHLYEVRFFDASTGFAAGNVLLKTTNGGANWVQITDGAFNGSIYSIVIRNSSVVYMSMNSNKVFKSTNLGTNWTLISQPSTNLNEIYFTDDVTGYGAGNNGNVFKTTNSGVNWFQNFIGSIQPLTSVLFINASTGFASGDEGKIYKSVDAGQNWTLAVNSSQRFKDLSVYGSSQIYACGLSGVSYLSNTGGASWTQLFQGAGGNITDIYFINAMTGWAANGSNDMLTTTNGGLNWQTAAFGNMPAMTNVWFLNNTTGFVIGNPSNDNGAELSIGKTTNGGLNFTELFITANSSHGIQFVNSSDGFAMFEDPSENALLYRTSNAGANWQLVNSANNNFAGFYFTTQLNGWMCGINGGMMKTTNGGANWIAQSTGVTEYLYSVYFQNANFGWACGTSGRIISTTNGGVNWTTQISGTSQPLADIKFISTTNGVCVGQRGTRLVTTNGGANWIANIESSLTNLNKISYAASNQVYAAGDQGYVSVSPGITGIEPTYNTIPEKYTLGQNYPNPFNPSTQIEFSLPQSRFVELLVYDVTGKIVKTLIQENLSEGNYIISFNAEGLSTGVYFYKLTTNEFSQVKKMMLIK